MTRKFFLIAAALATLSACEVADITQAPIPYTATKSLKAKGTHNFTARTFVKSSKGRNEVSGIPCTFTADGFKASFVTPALVTTPDMGQRTPPASITCKYKDVSKLEIMPAVNITVRDITASARSYGYGSGLVGLVVAGISESSQKSRRDATLDVYGYNNVIVQLDIED